MKHVKYNLVLKKSASGDWADGVHPRKYIDSLPFGFTDIHTITILSKTYEVKDIRLGVRDCRGRDN